MFLKIHKIRDVKLRWLQMRTRHKMLATNITWKKMGVVEDTQCKFCNNERDSIEDIFWKCDCIRSFWNRLEALLRDIAGQPETSAYAS